MRVLTVMLLGVGFVVMCLGIGWIAQGNDFFLYKTFAPKYEQVRRETFEQSKAYNQGVIQELQSMEFDYIRANKDQKLALRSIILHRSADYDMSKLPPDLANFINELRHQEETGQ